MLLFKRTLADGEAVVVDATKAIRVSVITEVGATAIISRVDNFDALTHTTGAHNSITVTASSLEVIDVDWAFYRISVAGGVARIMVV